MEKKADLNSLTIAELKKHLDTLKEEWLKLKINPPAGGLKDVHSPRKKRKEIAKVKTLISEKELIK